MTLQGKKELGVAVFTTLYTILFFLVMRLLFTGGSIWSIGFNVAALVGGVIWTAIMVAGISFVVNRVGVTVSLVILPALVLFIVSGFNIGSVIGAALLAAVVFAAQHSIHHEMNNQVKFKIGAIFRSGTKLLLLALVIALITLAQPVFRDTEKASSLLIKEQYIAAITKPISPLIGRYIPNYTNSTTIDQIIDAQLASQAEKLPPGFVLPPNQREQARTELSRQFGTTLTGQETLPGIVTTFLNGYIHGVAGQSTLAVAIATIAITLIAFRILVPFLVWPVIGVIVIIIDAAKRIGLIALVKDQVTIERIHL